jgi:hypothetical protein
LGEPYPRTFLPEPEVDELQLSRLNETSDLIIGDAKLPRGLLDVRESSVRIDLPNWSGLSTYLHRGGADLVEVNDRYAETLGALFTGHDDIGGMTHNVTDSAPAATAIVFSPAANETDGYV